MPIHSAQWNAFIREAAIASQSISAGLNALRKANYAATGLYSHAFFSLSIGLERLLKLIFILDYIVENHGKFPDESVLKRKFRHNIALLFSYAQSVDLKMQSRNDRYPLPENGIESDIVDFITKFSEGTRYYNLNYLAGAPIKGSTKDPIAEWYEKVGLRILEKHYSKAKKAKDEAVAELNELVLGPYSRVLHTAEDGSPLESMQTAVLQTGKNKVMQKYGTFYCVRIVRFLYMLLYDLEGPAQATGVDVPYLHELFFPFLNDDKYLLSLRTFPPRGQ